MLKEAFKKIIKILEKESLEYLAFESNAFKRKKKIKIFDILASFPSPEDLILFKIITGRKKDIIDAENVVKRHGQEIDKDYLIKWAMKLSDIAEDMRIYNRVIKLLRLIK